MKSSPHYQPVFEVTRGRIVESIHYGAIAVVDACGRFLAGYGDTGAVTFLRSSAKPFQAMPFIESKGHRFYNLSLRQVALICASHSGTDEHVAVAREIQAKAGVSESDLLCGTHPLDHQPTIEAMRQRGEALTPNRHNCSGKHTGMLAYASMKNLPQQDYVNPAHPIQQEILHTFAEMCDLPIERVEIGIDGCSAPNFAVPLFNAALAFARLSDPEAGGVGPEGRREACHVIVEAMTSHPDMVGGPERFDTELMRVAGGRIMAKAGAEGFQGLALLPGVLAAGSPGVGVAFKISDGDADGRARPALALEVLRQLGVLDSLQDQLGRYGPVFAITNWRKLEVGQARPCFELDR
jgi:L-asparaginase II